MNIMKIKVFEDISIPGVNLKDSVEKTIRRIYMGGYFSGAEATRDKAIEAFRLVHCSNCKYEWNCTNSFGCNDYDAFIQQLDKNK